MPKVPQNLFPMSQKNKFQYSPKGLEVCKCRLFHRVNLKVPFSNRLRRDQVRQKGLRQLFKELKVSRIRLQYSRGNLRSKSNRFQASNFAVSETRKVVAHSETPYSRDAAAIWHTPQTEVALGNQRTQRYENTQVYRTKNFLSNETSYNENGQKLTKLQLGEKQSINNNQLSEMQNSCLPVFTADKTAGRFAENGPCNSESCRSKANKYYNV